MSIQLPAAACFNSTSAGAGGRHQDLSLLFKASKHLLLPSAEPVCIHTARVSSLHTHSTVGLFDETQFNDTWGPPSFSIFNNNNNKDDEEEMMQATTI